MSRHTRRSFVTSAATSTAGLVIGFHFADGLLNALAQPAAGQAAAATAPAAAPAAATTGPALNQLDSWLRLAPDGRVSVFTGKVEIGMGVDVALRQIVAEELDVPLSRITMTLGDTTLTPDQGGVGASNSISSGGAALRNVSATLRHLLVQAAAQRLNVSADQLRVRDGVISAAADAATSVTYGELAADPQLQRLLTDPLKVNGAGFSLQVQGAGTPKPHTAYTVVGTAVPRGDIADKLFGTYKFAGDIRVPGMLHGRVVRPPGVGAHVVRVDDTAARATAGFVQVVVKGDFVGVVSRSEWGAVKAARALQVTWSTPEPAFPEQRDLYSQMRTVAPKATRETQKRGDAAAALQKAAKTIHAVYEYPFHSHATMSPGCAVADVRADGTATIWCGAQKPHALQRGYAELLGIPLEQTRVIWTPDSGSYGRPGFDDVGADAAVLSQALGRPVRVQWMRADLTGWGPKGPATVFEVRGGLDASGGVSGVEFTSRSFSGGEINFIPNAKGNLLAAQLMGVPNTTGFDEFAEWGGAGGGAASYAFPDVRSTAHVIPSFHAAPSPLAGTHLRDPNGPSTSFATESFMDELAAAAGLDPIAFRLNYLTDARATAVLRAAADKYGWEPRPSPGAGSRTRGVIARGRGASLGIRLGTYVGNVAEVEVNRQTGEVRIVRFVMAHDCGLVINPLGLTQTLQANVAQTLSRTMKEEVRFDRSRVTSVDWITYPVARMSDMPAQIDIVIVNRPEVPSTGAGEAGSRALAAAVGNAIFDAVGVRMRQVPLTPAKVKAALAEAGGKA